jgi:predicted kinase
LVSRPPLLVVTGPPGAGKTTLAAPLAARLRLPLIAKDTIKEALGDATPVVTVEESRRLGQACFAVMYALTSEQLKVGVGAVLETPLLRGVSEPGLGRLMAGSQAAIVHCHADPATLLARYEARATSGERHPVHVDAARLAEAELWPLSRYDPLDLPGPVLMVDTSSGYRPPFDELVRWAVEQVCG